MQRKWLAALLLLLWLPSSASASVLEIWDQWEADGLGITVQADHAVISGLNASENAVTLLNDLIGSLHIAVSTGPQGPVVSVQSDRQEGFTAFLQQEQTGSVPVLSSFSALESMFDTALPELFQVLSGNEPAEIEQRRTSFRVLGASPARQALELSPEELSFLDKNYLQPLFSLIRSAWEPLPEKDLLNAYLDQLTFEGNITFLRNLNAQQEDVAYQISGRIGSDGQDIRKMTVVIGRNLGIFYLSASFPAARGGNSVQWVLKVPQPSENSSRVSMEITLSYKYHQGEESHTISDTLKLVRQKNEGQTLTVSLDRTENVNDDKRVLEGTLKLTESQDHVLSGPLSWTVTHERTDLYTLKAQITVSQGEIRREGILPSTQVAESLLSFLLSTRNGLSDQDKLLFDHLLRNDTWMNGPSVPPLPDELEQEVV